MNKIIYSLLTVFVFSCNIFPGKHEIKFHGIKIPVKDTIQIFRGVPVNNGGFGSSLAVDPEDSTIFYILTDRGPCVKSSESYQRIFIDPGYTPLIGKYKLLHDSLQLISIIELKDENGSNLTGLPNQLSISEEDTLLIDLSGNKIGKDSLGIDPEGFVVLSDKTFWVCDEYGPNLIHFDSTGRTIEKITPPVSGQRSLPKVFAMREPNEGMEGLTIMPDGYTLIGIMQSPLHNPGKDDVRDSKVTRLISFNILTGETKQFIYLLEETNTNLSDITAITDTTFLVLERDKDFLYGSPNSSYKSVYKINISRATDISDPSNNPYGKLINNKTIEQLEDRTTLLSKGIIPVEKTLIINMVDIGYIHDKPEGIAIINNNTIAISNDDDFGIENSDKNIITTKKVPTENGSKVIDFNELVFITLEKPLINPSTSVEDNTSIKSFNFELKQNYPNPFNPVTVISYHLPHLSHVELKVFDILGREIKVLVNEEKPAGFYNVTFDAGNLSSGVYFYQLVTKNYISTKKMVLTK